MVINILAFGIAKDIFGNSSLKMELTDNSCIGDLKQMLEMRYPQLKQFGSYMIALNNEYALAEDIIRQSDEIAVVPPVSGG